MKDGNPFAGKLRVRVSALIVKSRSILLVKQQVPTRKDPIWLPPGGAVEFGEFSNESVKREVFEETNLEVSGLELRYVHEFVEPPYHALELYYYAGKHTGELKKGYDPELAAGKQLIIDVKFVPVKNIYELPVYPEFLKDEITSNNVNKPGIKHV